MQEDSRQKSEEDSIDDIPLLHSQHERDRAGSNLVLATSEIVHKTITYK